MDLLWFFISIMLVSCLYLSARASVLNKATYQLLKKIQNDLPALATSQPESASNGTETKRIATAYADKREFPLPPQTSITQTLEDIYGKSPEITINGESYVKKHVV